MRIAWLLSCLLFVSTVAAQIKITPDQGRPAKEIKEAELVAQLSKTMDQLTSEDEFSGAVLLAKDGVPIFEKAYGMASREYGVANRTDTKFNIGSIDKLFTIVAIGQLIQQGKIGSVDDKLINYFPDYPNKEAAEKITLRQILTMQSGIGDFFGPKFRATPKDQFRSIADYLPLFASEPLQFQPGTQRKYSNGGFIVLGEVIEKVSGQNYYDYVRANIFKPLGMDDTDFYEVDDVVLNRASGYTRRGIPETAPRRNNVYTLPARGSSAGGGYSTLGDLLKFGNAAAAGKILIPTFDDAAPAGRPFAVMRGLGFAGGAPGLNAIVETGLPGGYTLIVLSNYDPPSAERLSEALHGFMGLKMD